MRALAVSLALVLLLTGATCQRRSAEPVPAECNSICFSPCVSASGDTGVRWEADPNDAMAWDVLAGEDGPLEQLTLQVRTCDARREACVQCLQRLHRNRVIDLGAQRK